jgi:thioredoxin-dependent peroxiredoxin
MAPKIGVGDEAPDFTLPDQDGRPVTLGELRGRVVVLYFYPADETRGCTAEACGFRDAYQEFSDRGAEVIGVSSDRVASHRNFADHHRLPFRLLSDEGGAVRKRYGATMLGLIPGRVTYVIDPRGVVRDTFTSMLDAGGHIAAALKTVEELVPGQARGSS